MLTDKLAIIFFFLKKCRLEPHYLGGRPIDTSSKAPRGHFSLRKTDTIFFYILVPYCILGLDGVLHYEGTTET